MTATDAVDVVIVGGGVIGLSLAYELSGRGRSVAVLDRGELGRAASWAGAGLIAPLSERPTGDPMVQLRSRGAELYPLWSERLKGETGIDNGYRRTGGLDVALADDEANDLRSMAGRWRLEGVVFEHLSDADRRRIEPALAPDAVAAYFLPDRAQIRNPWHLRALAASCERRGVVLRPNTPALGFATAGGRVRGVTTAAGEIAAEHVVVSAGPWTGVLLEGVGAKIATPPVKGEILLLRGRPGQLRRIIEHGKNYLVPRDDGLILVGATEEEAGFDTASTAEGQRILREAIARLCPSLGDLPAEGAWAGLRPGSFDTRPYIGPLPGFENLWVVSGHKRAGLQLAPSTAELVADLLAGEAPRINPAPFRLDRAPEFGDAGSIRS